ncbi:amidohydrolase family protein [Amycolatopsis echigonensis]|uniref:Imidazolonepropionase-like amidohydrolase n=1 Tax=Amycolatopsis echigonensis TaxID=2576905 RepID=A0A2N3WS48_9PSEU|nr:amidohydrolase family protein [Amycolatopsis niigatensis]PKV96698.1 imidazolonepropionase-like amidohydrolase [Amycolatopsis niigatensis]
MTKTALTGVRVFDGTGLTEPATVVIDGPLIGTDATGAEVLDCTGATVLPGLFDAHVHLLAPDDLHALAAHGVTTALDMACWPRERVDSFRGQVPDIRSAGLPAIGPGGNHAKMPGMPGEAILTGPEQAAPFVARRVAEGSDYLKVVIEGDLLDQPTIDAVVAAGKAHGKLTVAHASSVDAYRRAVRAGADVVTHVPRDGVLDADTVAQMAGQSQVAVPTLAMMEALTTKLGADGYAFSRDSVTALRAAGVPILAGTDAFSAPLLPVPVLQGSSLHRELALLVEAGLTECEALRAATELPARHFGFPDRGAVRAGLRADLVLVDGDPTREIAATAKIRRVWAEGEAVR